MNTQKLRVLFFGTPDFASTQLRTLLTAEAGQVVGVITQPDRPAGRGKQVAESPVKSLALEHRLPIFQPRILRKELVEFENFCSSIDPIDLGIVVAFGQILPVAVLNRPRLGCINTHASLLPRWRGAAPIQRAILAEDARTGVCLMQMDEGLDTGAVLSQADLDIEATDTFGTLHDKLATLSSNLLLRSLPKIGAQKLAPLPQPSAGVSYANKISSEECEVDWNRPANAVSAQIRGLSPFPGAYTWLTRQRLKLLMAHAQSNEDGGYSPVSHATPGTITRADSGEIRVQCSAGTVSLTQLQLEGRKRLGAEDFLRGVPLSQGTKLGERP